MAILPGQFNPQEHSDMQDFSAFPEDWYHLQVIDSEIALTKKAQENKDPSLGQMLKLKIQVMDGKYKGRFIFVQYNIINPNPEAQRISNEAVATLCRAVGFQNGLPEGDTVHLHGKPFDGKVAIEKGNDGYPDRNKINNFKPYGTQQVDASGASQGQQSAKIDTPKTASTPIAQGTAKQGSVW